MSANSVDSDQYVDGSIDAAHLADDAVTGPKLSLFYNTYGTIGAVDISTAFGDTEFVLSSLTALASGLHLIIAEIDTYYPVAQFSVDYTLRMGGSTIGASRLSLDLPDGAGTGTGTRMRTTISALSTGGDVATVSATTGYGLYTTAMTGNTRMQIVRLG